jgi:hypothetical protein
MNPEPFPQVFYINLEDRPERRRQVEAELARIGLQAERFPAVRPVEPAEIALRRLSCKLSHLGVVQKAMQQNMPSVLVLEDDVVFCDDFLARASECLHDAASVQWDLLYFGYESFGYDHGKLMPVTSRLARTQSTYLTHCYAIHSRCFTTYTDLILRSEVGQALDSVFVHSASRLKVYCSVPKLARQRPGFSDIEQAQFPSGRG